MRLPRLLPTAQVIDDGHRVLILTDRAEDDLEVEGDPQVVGRLLSALDGRTPIEDIVDQMALPAGEVVEGIHALAEAGLVDDAADDAGLSAEDLDRYERQLRYFAEVGDEPRARYQRRLAETTVCVLGLGGLGGMAGLMLASCGIGRLIGVDGDTVEPSNLARQVMFGRSDVGRSKVEATARRLAGLRGDMEFVGIEATLRSTQDIAAAIAGADIVVAAVDWPATTIGRWVNEACMGSGVPYVSMSQHPPLIRVGPTYVPGRTGCYACQERAYRERFDGYEALIAAAASESPAATFAPACGVIGSLVANEVIALATGLHEPGCLGRSWLLDLRTLAVTSEPFERRGGCPVCGGSAPRPAPRERAGSGSRAR